MFFCWTAAHRALHSFPTRRSSDLDDDGRWLEDSRYVRSARPDQQGTFQIKGLPPGDYLAVALEYVEDGRSEEHTSELQSHVNLVCRLLLEKKNSLHAARRDLILVS